ncbi:MAG TPA: hypothetical protein VFP72_18405 [Kineosporiaceae bacterium]|nr:hypothetical protein [Kineosporiaceae bacterium]
MTGDDVIIRLTHDQALVLSDRLFKVVGTGALDDVVNQDRAVWSPLHTISGVLESTLEEVFSPNYDSTLHEVRERLLDQLGDLGRPPGHEGRDSVSGNG